MKLASHQFSASTVFKSPIRMALLVGEDEKLLSLKSHFLIKGAENRFLIQRHHVHNVIDKPELILGQHDLFSFSSNNVNPFLFYIRSVESDFKIILEKFFQVPSNNFLLLEAPFLSKTSALFKYCEQSAHSMLVSFYEAILQDKKTLLLEYFPHLSFSLQQLLLSSLSSNLSQATQELEKLSLLCGGDCQSLSKEWIENFCDSHATSQETEFPTALSLKNFPFVFGYYNQANVSEKISLIRKSIYYFIRLYIVRSQLENKVPYSTALKKLNPPLFFKQKTSFANALQQWSSEHLLGAIASLKRIESECKKNTEIDFLLF